MNTMENKSNINSNYILTLRAERPIQACELTPNAYVQVKDPASGRPRMVDPNSVYYSFSWKRGPRTSGCCNPDCERGKIFEPSQWSKQALGGPELLCNVCATAGYATFEATFCSRKCFLHSWKDHSKRHLNLRKLSSLSETTGTPPNENETDEPIEEDEKPATSISSVSYDQTEENQSWVSVSQDRTYFPTAEDIGCRLRIDVWVLSTADGSILAGPTTLFTEPVLSSPVKPPKRALQTIPGSGSGISGAVRFRIVTYNILAELYATKQAYPYVDMWNLSWPYRRKILFEELEDIQGDIVCLQEVQADHFETDINPFMASLGYDGIYKSKSREYMGQYGKVDGCATFWKKTKFSMIENYSLEFNDLARQEASTLGLDDGDARRYMNRLHRDNIAQIIVLESLSRSMNNRNVGRSSLCVVNTHIYSNNQRVDVKLWQSLTLIREIQQFVSTRDLALVICGDFNSEPTSAVYEYMINGGINLENHPELFSEDHVRILPDPHEIIHNLEFASAMMAALGTEPMFTNYTAKFKGTLDYIFYTPSRLRVLAVTAPPDEQDLRTIAGDGLPCPCYPSDHVLLSCDVAMINSGTGSIFASDMTGSAAAALLGPSTVSPPLQSLNSHKSGKRK